MVNKQQLVLGNLFSVHELHNAKSLTSLAGLFAAKESVVKALGLVPGNWQQIEIIKETNGKPAIKLLPFSDQNILSCDLTITHDGDYAFATVCFLING